jgi:hypothetical protein
MAVEHSSQGSGWYQEEQFQSVPALSSKELVLTSPCSGIIYRAFQGEVKIQTQEVIVNKNAARPIFDISRGKPRLLCTRKHD